MPSGWFAAAAFAAASGFYFLLAGSASWTECVAAAGVAAATAGFMSAYRTGRRRPVSLSVPPRAVLLRTALAVFSDSARVGAALARALVGRVEGREDWQPFDPGGQNPHDAGRRALATVLASLAPNGFVLDLRPSALPDADRAVLLHRLVPAPAPPDEDWPA